MNLYSLLTFAFRKTFNKPIEYLTIHLVKYLDKSQYLRKKVIEIGRVVIHSEEKNLIAKSERKFYKKYYSCNNKQLCKGAESCVELGFLTLIGILPLYIYFKRMFQQNQTLIDKDIAMAELMQDNIDQQLKQQIENSSKLQKLQEQVNQIIISYNQHQQKILSSK